MISVKVVSGSKDHVEGRGEGWLKKIFCTLLKFFYEVTEKFYY